MDLRDAFREPWFCVFLALTLMLMMGLAAFG
jgi:hypothetical protein